MKFFRQRFSWEDKACLANGKGFVFFYGFAISTNLFVGIVRYKSWESMVEEKKLIEIH